MKEINMFGLIGGLVLVFVGGIGMFSSCEIRSGNPAGTVDHIVEFPEVGSKLYIRARVGGLTSDHEETRIEAKPVNAGSECSSDCFIIHDSEILYRKTGSDTIEIYAITAKVPQDHINSIGRVKVRIVEVDTYEELTELEEELQLIKVEAPERPVSFQ